jgi:hypothetical protein
VNRLTQVVVALPNHWAAQGTEVLWARRAGVDVYQIVDVPFFAYDLHYGDVVRADPVVRALVRRSGHTTLRIVFRRAEESRARRIALLSELAPLGVSFESWDGSFFALDVAPDGDVDAVLDRLEWLEKRDTLGFETCEARCRGSFDDEDHSSLRAG